MSISSDIVAMIGSYNELYTGQQATPEVLKSMLKDLCAHSKKGINMGIGKPDNAYMWLGIEADEDGDNELQLTLLGPSGPGGPPTMGVNCYGMTEKGLPEPIVDGKEFLKRYHRDGVCECKTRFNWCLKLEGGTHCLQCTANKAMGM